MLSEYTLANVKGVKKSFDNAAEADILKWKDTRLFNIVETTEWSEIFNSTESMDGIIELSENQTPPTCSLDEGYQVTLSPQRFGGAIEITEKRYDESWRLFLLISLLKEKETLF